MITHKNIYGWFDKDAEKFYSMIIDKFPDGSHFVEIGAFYGQSTCFMAQEIKNRKRNIRFDTIDHFKGSPEHQKQLQGVDLYYEFLMNMKRADVLEVVLPIAMDHNKAINLYDDNSLEFVFIDADHSYESVKHDSQLWLPKIKIGGILAGDDYVYKHPGVIKAVDEIFAKTVKFIGRNWYFEKS